eukprot:PITA_12235
MNKPITNGRVTRWLLLLQEFNITVLDRPGKQNTVANFLSKIQNIKEDSSVEDKFPDEYLFAVTTQTPWFADVANYSVTEKLPSHLFPREKRKIIQESARYSWITNELYKKGPNFMIRRCVREDEMPEILKACQDEPCSGHFADKRTAYKILSSGYYWPSIFKDAKEYFRRCDSYQRVGKPAPSNEMPLKNQDIFTRFGVLREIVIDRGSQFTSNMVESLVEEYKIKHRKSTPYHPQAIGHMESTNKVIEGILTKIVHLRRRDWAERLPGALWAYITTWRNTAGHTPYELVYGKQVLFPIKFQIRTFKREVQLGLDLSEAQKNRLEQLNELDEIKQEAVQRIGIFRQHRAKWHDKYIKDKRFQEEDWALLFDSKFKDFQGKFQTH